MEGLNDQQREAVSYTKSPLLVLAGAGTGKTKVLTSRIIYLVNETHVSPSQILAVAFTNKAADEIKQRISPHLGDKFENSVNIGTFHSVNAKILRQHAEVLGYGANYTIINSHEQLRLAKQIICDFGLDEKLVHAKTFVRHISSLKDSGISSDSIIVNKYSNFANNKLPELYREYQQRLLRFNAMDFGDLILNVITLFNKHIEICRGYQNKYKYILVDEYQDVNIAQYLWIRSLTQNGNNLFCVGDDDQSIYTWRGAKVSNILRFDKDFFNSKVICLEQNYRSTQNILNAANNLIKNNKNRRNKKLWSNLRGKQDVRVVSFYDDKEESSMISKEISFLNKKKGIALGAIAVLVRAGYQNRVLEESFNYYGLSYKVVGSRKFYDRAEVKDVISYIKLVVNQRDNIAFERVVNSPKKGIGTLTLKEIILLAQSKKISYFTASQLYTTYKKSKVRDSLSQFLVLIEQASLNINNLRPQQLVEDLLVKSGYTAMLQQTLESSNIATDNIRELTSTLKEYRDLSEYLEHATLDINRSNDRAVNNDAVSLMTIHAAKGLEFNHVFLPGWEEGILPGARSLEESKECALEEERRLGYVAITRAKRSVCISHTSFRYIYGERRKVKVSRFVNELINNNRDRDDGLVNKQLKGRLFEVGTKVSHEVFGRGTVISCNENFRQISFQQGIAKNIRVDFLEEYE